MKRVGVLLSALALGAAVTAALPASAEEATLPGGTTMAVNLDTPSDTPKLVIQPTDFSVEATVAGTASVGAGVPVKDTTLVFVMDLSGSMRVDAGRDCDGAPGTETLLECEQHGVATVNQAAAAPRSTIGLVGLASFSSGSQAHDVDLGAPGTQLLVAPDHDGDGNGTRDVEDVASDLATSGSTNYAAGLRAAFDIINNAANTNSASSTAFMSDGQNNTGANVRTLSAPAATTINSFALGAEVSCASDGAERGSLNDVAALSTTGTGSCEQVEDLSQLADAIEKSRDSTLDRLELTVDEGAPTTLSSDEIDPDLSAAGPVTVDYATVSSLRAGAHELCVTAFGEDAGGKGSATVCANVPVTQGILIDIDLDEGGGTPVAALSTDSFDATTIDVDSTCFGDAETPSERDCEPAHNGHREDVDDDGDIDLVLHFETQQTGIDAGDTEGCLTGETTGRAPVEGCGGAESLGDGADPLEVDGSGPPETGSSDNRGNPGGSPGEGRPDTPEPETRGSGSSLSATDARPPNAVRNQAATMLGRHGDAATCTPDTVLVRRMTVTPAAGPPGTEVRARIRWAPQALACAGPTRLTLDGREVGYIVAPQGSPATSTTVTIPAETESGTHTFALVPASNPQVALANAVYEVDGGWLLPWVPIAVGAGILGVVTVAIAVRAARGRAQRAWVHEHVQAEFRPDLTPDYDTQDTEGPPTRTVRIVAGRDTGEQAIQEVTP